MSGIFAALNRDKQGIALDLKTAEGQAVLHRLVQDADVLIEGFRPGVMKRLNADYDTLKAINPRLIYCSISGYGQSGPFAQRAGHDMNYLAIAGLLAPSGKDGEVIQPGIQTADIAGGALYPVIGILAALNQRHATGEGQFIDAAMTDGAAGLGVMLHAKQHLDHKPVTPGSDDLAGGKLCYRIYRCADGGSLAVGALEPKFWMGLCQAIGQPELMPDGYAEGKRRAPAEEKLVALFASKTRDEWVETFAAHDICVEPVLDPAEARLHPHAIARGLYGTHDHPAEGANFFHFYPNPQLLPEAAPHGAPRPAPTLGQDTRAVLGAAGYSAEEIDALADAGVIRG
jgi:crotonobetainyl-CoA:carnitine CoA-transferase CaiB-like acyl-CoA transferase